MDKPAGAKVKLGTVLILGAAFISGLPEKQITKEN